MTNFWANKLGAARPAAPAPAPAQQQQPGGPWWAPPQQQPYPPQQPAQQTVPQPAQEKAPARAMVAKQDTHCPDCGGSNYFRPIGQPNAMAQCYECGYNPRFQQTTAGLPSGSGGDGPATPAKQIASGGLGGRSNYNPGAIIRPDGSV
ncbi:hypothetical protein ACFRNJ_12110 [Streptomyces sp. NPDC056721]|uniref:hypothetical protein n=1 Tax=Streptomyces sp. NPDC056721 TaxID=3345923 RepID=UPI00369E38F2